MNVATIGMRELSLDLRTIRKSGRYIHATGMDEHGDKAYYLMDKICMPNLLSDTYGYAHVLFATINGKTERCNKYYSLG